jgi:2-methylcitrate dehydratase PrpD
VLAEFLADTTYGDLPASVVDECYRATLDWLGSALAGALEPPARIAQNVAHGLGSSDDATMLGAGVASAPAAALANGVASHILELDDVHKGSTLIRRRRSFPRRSPSPSVSTRADEHSFAP